MKRLAVLVLMASVFVPAMAAVEPVSFQVAFAGDLLKTLASGPGEPSWEGAPSFSVPADDTWSSLIQGRDAPGAPSLHPGGGRLAPLPVTSAVHSNLRSIESYVEDGMVSPAAGVYGGGREGSPGISAHAPQEESFDIEGRDGGTGVISASDADLWAAAMGGSSNLDYVYQKRTLSGGVTGEEGDSSGEVDPVPGMGSNLNYLYGRSASSGPGKDGLVEDRDAPVKAPSAGGGQIPGTYSGSIYSSSLYSRSSSNLEHIYRSSRAGTGAPGVKEIAPGLRENLGLIIGGGLNDCWTSLLGFPCNLPVGGTSAGGSKHPTSRNYAVVVGINEYADRMSLHTSVNDAGEISKILEAYGYEVLELTDETAVKPTKKNILDGALAKVNLKSDRDKVVFYFSGHGVRDGKSYYLVPQDSDGDPSSYISVEDLKQYIGGMENLALIVDACNSGELGGAFEAGQVVLTSSGRDEPSNEIWPGSLSVFTYNLCNAIRDEGQTNGEISLQRCFYKARNKTVVWSSRRLLTQTPVLGDGTGGLFRLN